MDGKKELKQVRFGILVAFACVAIIGMVFATHSFGTPAVPPSESGIEAAAVSAVVPGTDWAVLVLIAGGASFVILRLKRRRTVATPQEQV
jgi:hypothetical protein